MLEITALLHAVGDRGLGFEFRIPFEGEIDLAIDGLKFALEFVALSVGDVARTVFGDIREDRFIQIDGLFKKLCGVFEDDDTLNLIVVDGGSIMLDLLLKLLELEL